MREFIELIKERKIKLIIYFKHHIFRLGSY